MTAIETNAAWLTVRVAEATIEPDAAEIVATPTPVAVAKPPLAMVAMLLADEVQLTELVRFWVLPSL